MGRPAKSSTQVTPSVEEKNLAEGENTLVEKTVDEKESTKTEKNSVKTKEIKDDDVVKIICKSRAGKTIHANTLNEITFDEKGVAECKGLEAKYLLSSNLGFTLA